MIKKEKRNMIKAAVLVVMILIADFFTIMNMTLGDTDLTNFRCDIERIDSKSYKADVHVTINFTFNRQDATNVYAIMGDGGVVWDIPGTNFSYNYSIEGIYNVTLWAQIPGLDSEWLIIEIRNEAPEFEIGIAPIEYYPATYDFEDDELGRIPHNWEIYDNNIPIHLISFTKLYNGQTVSGSYQDLKHLDGNKWVIRTNNVWPYSDIDIDVNFESIMYELLPGAFELYFQANRSMILRENTGFGDYRKVFEGDSSFGEKITLDTTHLELVASLEDIFQSIEIDWLMIVAIDNGVAVTKDVDDHGKITQVSLLNSSTLCGLRQNFPSQLYGTIELWYKTSETKIGGRVFSQSNYYNLIQKNHSWFLGLTNITSEIGFKPLPYTWYHIRIDWRAIGSSPYQSLNSGYYRIFINGNPSNQYSLNSGGLGISTLNIETNTTVFIDAVGYTWEGYAIGDNKNSIYPQNIYEDQEITFNVINLSESYIDKKGFSFNYGAPIVGNYSYLWDFANGNYSSEESPSFSFSKAGDYPVRLTLVDDQGAMTTKVRTISIKNRQPETSIWSGINFDATYDFKHDLSGEPPSGWTTAGNIEVVDFKDKFSKVVEIDNTAGGFGSMDIKENIGITHNSIEFWIYFSDVNEDKFYFRAGPQFVSDPKEEIRFGLFEGVWKYYYTWEDPVLGTQYDYAAMSELSPPQSEEWTHVRFQLINYDEWRIFVNDISSQSYNNVGNFYIFNIGLFVEPSSHVFLDSFGFASDPEYDIGDNNPPKIDTYYASWDFRYYPNGPISYDLDKKLSTLGPWAFTSYGFEEIADGCSANIIPELDDHYKILELHDNNESDVIIASLLDISKPKYGTIEFWLRSSDVSQGLLMTFGYEVFRSGISINSDGRWSYKNSNREIVIDDVPQLEDNEWHHIRIDFDSRENGGYLGLGPNQFYFRVDTRFSRLGPFNFDDDVSDLKWNLWSSKEEGRDYSIFLD
ncbi:MAG: PKD domain-containing protein, partial [Promethearchaeota archaeon]